MEHVSSGLYFTESDLRSFLREPEPSRHSWTSWVGGSLVFLLVATGLYFLFNFSALTRLDSIPVAASLSPTAPSIAVVASPSVAKTTPTSSTPILFANVPSIPENILSYSDLGISVPVLWDIPLNDQVVQEKLKDGIVHIAGTPKPGQQGYSVMVGHSSNYPWVSGCCNTTFAPLLKAQLGQDIVINFQNKEYHYRVSKIYEVKPTDLSVLENGNGNGIRLITCSPIGTSLRRWVVEANQISPAPSSNTSFDQAHFSGSIPSGK